uniref:Uncharacterized protein n=1 Tax=viral metagenome TaxID=1070528 RepID=A0A6M3MA71_9ZZZZ
MPICPKCGKPIDELKAYAREESFYRVYLDSAGLDYDIDSLGYDYQQCVEGSATHTDFQCPECGAILFSSEADTQPEEVINFLKGD